jgi:hypothetical protein
MYKEQSIFISITWINKHDITVGELNASRESSGERLLLYYSISGPVCGCLPLGLFTAPHPPTCHAQGPAHGCGC